MRPCWENFKFILSYQTVDPKQPKNCLTVLDVVVVDGRVLDHEGGVDHRDGGEQYKLELNIECFTVANYELYLA